MRAVLQCGAGDTVLKFFECLVSDAKQKDRLKRRDAVAFSEAVTER
jgi:hypothetical protein